MRRTDFFFAFPPEPLRWVPVGALLVSIRKDGDSYLELSHFAKTKWAAAAGRLKSRRENPQRFSPHTPLSLRRAGSWVPAGTLYARTSGLDVLLFHQEEKVLGIEKGRACW